MATDKLGPSTPEERKILNTAVKRYLDKPTDNTPTGRLTDEQIDAEVQRMGRGYRPWELRELCRRIEEIVRQAISAKTEPVSKAFVEAIRKDERERARQHIWVRKGVQRAECCRAALEDARVTLLDDEPEPENFSRKSEGP